MNSQRILIPQHTLHSYSHQNKSNLGYRRTSQCTLEVNGKYRKQRTTHFWDLPGFNDLDEYRQSTVFMEEMLSRQQPLIFEGDIFGFNRYLIDRPGVDANSHVVIEGIKYFERYSNITPAYELLIDRGVDDMLRELSQRAETAEGEALQLYNEAAVICGIYLRNR